jgi:ERCC4-type nuclease
MRLIIDIREHDLIEKLRQIISANPNYVTIETEALPIGDILVKTDEGKDVLIVERKSLQDLLASIKDGRYEEQSHRLKHASGFASHNVVYLIEGMFSTLRTPLEKKLVMSTMTSLYYFKGFAVLRTSGLQESAELLIHMADKIDRNFMKGVLPWYLEVPAPSSVEASVPPLASGEPLANTFVTPSNPAEEPPAYSGFVKKVKKENITAVNIGELMLCQIPGIQTKYASTILAHYGSFSKMLEALKSGTASFDEITYDCNGKKRKIPKSCGESILLYLLNI